MQAIGRSRDQISRGLSRNSRYGEGDIIRGGALLFLWLALAPFRAMLDDAEPEWLGWSSLEDFLDAQTLLAVMAEERKVHEQHIARAANG